MNIRLFLTVLIYAILNGSIEELFWRGTFHNIYGSDRVRSYLLPTILFTCWHFSLLFANGMSYHGGALALVGGAGVMGLIWGLTMYKTRNIKLVIVAHVMSNFFAFSQLLYENLYI